MITRFAGLALIALALARPVTAGAGIPDPALSTIPNVVASPNGTIPYRVTIVGQGGPVADAQVQLRWRAAAESGGCWCAAQGHPVVSAATNASGVATFNVAGGLCLNPAVVAGGVAVEVFVNEIKLKEVGQVSPDVVAAPAGTCEVGLSDAVEFTSPLATNTYSYCYDLNSDGAVGLTDAVIFTSPAATAQSCPQ
jgi:hypothetical protein